ncbi:recombinase family protein [Oscillospiraceae bacterium WX1]
MTTRVAAYCRVSTELCDQQTSFDSQKTFFTDYIAATPGWSLYQIYADEGISGTSAAPRIGFLDMLGDAKLGLFDLVVTKEISRFSRNLLDTVRYTRALKRWGVGVLFLNDGISTLDPDAELRLNIMASVAQEESRKTSERVKWGQRRRMERGVVFGRSLLGYTAENGSLTVEPCGAAIVRRIYSLFLDGRCGVRQIAHTLTEDGILTPSGKTTWSGGGIYKILRNEKYCGDLVQRKTITVDYLSHQKIKNPDFKDYILLLNHHEPIIPRATWVAAQEELNRRNTAQNADISRAVRYPLSGKVSCGVCGKTYRCRTRRRRDGSVYRLWVADGCRCCDALRSLREEAVVSCVQAIVSGLDGLSLTQNLSRVLKHLNDMQWHPEPAHAVTALREKQMKLTDAYLSGDVEKAVYNALKEAYQREESALCHQAESVEAIPVKENAPLLAALSVLCAGMDDDDVFYLSLVESVTVTNGGVTIRLFGLSAPFQAQFED